MNDTYQIFAKRLFDIAVSLTLLTLALPALLVVAALVRWRLGKPMLFRQLRPGLHEQPFRMLKFRTMTNARDADERLLPDDQRLTPLGRFLRKWSLDELPQLWNVLRGDMSLVGPRPLLMQYLDRYTREQARRHEVKPGVTGWAQVNGRNAISWEARFQLDIWYVDNCSLLLDLAILWRTVSKALQQHGISAEGQATMPEFEGFAGGQCNTHTTSKAKA